MASEMPSQVLQGSCLSMCPPSEMTLRHREGLVHPMECRPPLPNAHPQQSKETAEGGASKKPSGKKDKKGSSLKGDPQYFVKEFARSSAGREIRACDVRSLPVLVRTIRYLLTDAYKRVDCSQTIVHDFISNRLRAVRQDLAVQDLMNSIKAAPLLAASVRYAALQLYRMCELPASEYNPFLDMKQLQETLTCLVRLYKDHSNKPPPEPPAFSFDLDDEDDEEFFFEFDVNTGKVNQKSSGPNVSCQQESRSDTVLDSNRRQPTFGTERTSECESAGSECHQSSEMSSQSIDDSGFIGTDSVTNGELCNGIAGSFTSYRGSDEEEVSRVLTRISAMSLETMRGETQGESTSTEKHSKDDKNRYNKSEGENVKEPRKTEDESVLENVSDSRGSINSDQFSNINADKVENPTSTSSNHSPVSSSEGQNSNSRFSPVSPESVNEREEIECLYLLLNYDKSEAVEHALELPAFVKEGMALKRVLPAVLSYHSHGNTTALLRLLHTLPPLLCSTLYLSLPKIQRKVLQVLSTGHSSANCRYPLSELASQLVLPDAEAARQICRHFGLKLTGEQLQFVSFNKNDFCADAAPMPLQRAPWLDAKLAASGAGLLLPHPLL